MPEATFYDREYFEGRTRWSPPHQRELIYPLAERTARFLCRDGAPSHVLDLGCAKGYLIEAFQAQGVAHVLGLDVSLYAASHTERSARGRVLVGNVQAELPLRSATFDLVTALDLFEHLERPLPILKEIQRVLTAQGKVYLKICHPRHPNATRDPTHINVQPRSYWTGLFQRAGFRWRRVYESDVTGWQGVGGVIRAMVRGAREWATIGTPADYKFMLWKRI
ncbi:MAG: class I SAM-dependent methyltransferase [Nitrospiraceae bacterium]